VVYVAGAVLAALLLMVLRISACPKRKRAPGLVHPVALATSLVYHLLVRPV